MITKEIFKIQRPICTNHEPELLVYNESREINFFMDMDETLSKMFNEDEFKIYVWAECDTKLEKFHVISKLTEEELEELFDGEVF